LKNKKGKYGGISNFKDKFRPKKEKGQMNLSHLSFLYNSSTYKFFNQLASNLLDVLYG